MTYFGSLNSIFTSRVQGSQEQAPTYSRFTKLAAGLGVAGLAVLSWKVVATGALAYSAYRGGRYLQHRLSQKHQVSEGTDSLSIDVEEHLPISSVSAGHDAHSDQQPGEQRQAEVERPEQRQVQPQIVQPAQSRVEDFPRFDHILDLRNRQKEAKTRAAKNTFEILLTHPDIAEKGKNIHWVAKMIKKHAIWAKRTFGLSLYAVKFYRMVKNCIPKRNRLP